MQSNDAPATALKNLLGAFEVLDFDRVSELIAEDTVFEFPYGGYPPLEGRAAILEHLRTGMANFVKSMDFTIQAIHPAADPELVFAEYTSTAVRVDGGPYGNRYICMLRLRGGKIVLFREFYNPVLTAAAKA